MARKLIVSEVELGGNSRNYESENVTLEVGFYDFVPVFRIDPAQKPVLLIVSDDSCARCKKEEITLDAKYDAKYRKYKVPDIVMPRNNMGTFYLQIIKGDPPAAFTNDDGVISRIEIKPNDGKVKLIYDKKKCENISYGDNFEITLDNKSQHPAKYKLRIYTKDWKTKEMLAGEFNLINISRNAFSQFEIESMKEHFIKNATIDINTPNHTDCITTLNKALKILLKNRSLSVGSKIDVTMKKLINQGYIDESSQRIIEYLDENNSITYGIKEPKTATKKVSEALIELMNNEIGFHVFGLSIADGYHSLAITVDNQDLCNPKFFLSDQNPVSWGYTDGWREFDAVGIDNWITSYTRGSAWDGYIKTRTTIWKINR